MRLRPMTTTCALVALALVAACGSDTKPTAAADASAIPEAVCTKATLADLEAAGFASSPNACSGQMYAKYKEAGFAAVNGKIAELALAAPVSELGDTFQTKIAQASTARQQEFAGHLLLFLETAYGRTDKAYDGPAMTPAHANLAITIAQYKYFITDVVVPALIASGVEESDINNCFAPAVTDPSFVSTVVTCK